MIRVLSLTQPWASALFTVPPLKTIETRDWAAAYRGVLYIHASKKFTREDKTFAADHGLTPECLPLGYIIGSVFLDDIQRTERLRDSLSDLELSWGDYGPQRFAWILKRPMRLADPIKVKGSLGIWTFDSADPKDKWRTA